MPHTAASKAGAGWQREHLGSRRSLQAGPVPAARAMSSTFLTALPPEISVEPDEHEEQGEGSPLLPHGDEILGGGAGQAETG